MGQEQIDGSFAENIDFEFTIGGITFSQLWFLVDGLYPPLARFVS
jgi:hypothetical protein